MKYKVKIPLANYPETRTHDKEFDNVLDVIDYFKAIINDEIEDDWNCHIDEAKGLQYLIKNKLEDTVSKEYFESIFKYYGEKEMIDYMFQTYTKLNYPTYLKERILQWLKSEKRTNLKIPTVPLKEIDAVLKEQGWEYQEHCGFIHWSKETTWYNEVSCNYQKTTHYIDLEYDLYNTIDFELKKCQ